MTSASALAARLDALARFRHATEPYLPLERLLPVHTVAERARQRLAYHPDLTVVALAGPTGSGKSSVFNALAGRDLSPVGVRRPTTSATYACVWGDQPGATGLLDWLQVVPEHRFVRESQRDAGDQAALRGMVLLDLPDFDSVERDHAAEVERLLGMVDMVVWIVDPQKYADRVVHERYLRPFRRHREVTVVALNQADLLRPEEVTVLLDDLRRVLTAGGLGGTTTMATSATDLPAGLAQLQAQLVTTVSSRRAAWLRLAADVDAVVEDLSELVGPPVAADTAERAAFGELTDGLADAAGVSGVVDSAELAYRSRAGASLGSLPRWFTRTDLSADVAEPTLSGVGPTTTRVVARLAVRTVTNRAADGLPPPWPEAVATAGQSRLADLPGALTAAVRTAVARASERTTQWWRLVAVWYWLIGLVGLVALSWLLVGGVLWAVGLPVSLPQAAGLPVPVLLLVVTVLGGAAAIGLVRPLLRWTSRRARIRARMTLRAEVAGVGSAHVVTPVQEVLHAYAEARAALHAAAGM